jgi:hypothetical protein
MQLTIIFDSIHELVETLENVLGLYRAGLSETDGEADAGPAPLEG